jgi:curved DNA-binding protein CbpA
LLLAGFLRILPFFVLMNLADCYRLLGLRTGASYEDIKASYRRLARQCHPDVNPDNPQQAKEKFIQLTEAYKLLTSIVPPSSGSNIATSTTSDDANSVQAAQSPQVKVTRKPPTIRRNPFLSEADQRLKETAYRQLQQLLREQRFPRAIALVEGLAQRLPSDTEVRQWQAITYQRWGRCLISQQQVEKARIYLKKALRTDPHNKSLWYEVERDFRRIEQTELL